MYKNKYMGGGGKPWYFLQVLDLGEDPPGEILCQTISRGGAIFNHDIHTI